MNISEEEIVTIRNWIKFFLRAMLIGGVITGVAGLIVRLDFYSNLLSNGEYIEFIAAFLWMIFLGFTMSVVAQMGFFAYLTIHQFGINMFRTLTLWNWVQVVIIAFVIFDLIYFRFMKGDAAFTGLYVFWMIVLLGAAVVTAILKVKWTKPHTLIPALFFMIVVTTLEWLPALMVKTGNIEEWSTILLFPLVAVNSFQLLALPKYNRQSEEDTKNLEARRAARKETKAEKKKSKRKK